MWVGFPTHHLASVSIVILSPRSAMLEEFQQEGGERTARWQAERPRATAQNGHPDCRGIVFLPGSVHLPWNHQSAHDLFTMSRLTPVTSTGVEPRCRHGHTNLTAIDWMSLRVYRLRSKHAHKAAFSVFRKQRCHPQSPSHQCWGGKSMLIGASRANNDSQSHLRMIYRGSKAGMLSQKFSPPLVLTAPS